MILEKDSAGRLRFLLFLTCCEKRFQLYILMQMERSTIIPRLNVLNIKANSSVQIHP